MRILTLCDVLFPQTTGGAGRYARELAEGLVQAGDQVQILTRDTGRRPRRETIPTEYFPSPGMRSPSLFRSIFREIEARFRPDVIHVHQPLPAFLCIPRGFERPVVYTFHSSWPEEFKLKASVLPAILRNLVAPLLARLERRLVKTAAAVTVLSAFNQRVVERLYHRQTVVIPGGVNSDFFRPSYGRLQTECLRVVSLRNLVPRMGMRNLVRSIPLLPENVQLKIGGDGPLRAALDQLIGQLNLRGRVELCGHIPDDRLPAFYSDADLFVLPTSALEGFGLVIIESLSCGTPVLGTNIGAIPEILKVFNPSWVIPESTPEAIAKSISVFIGQEPKPDRAPLHERVRSEYDWEIITARYRNLFAQVL